VFISGDGVETLDSAYVRRYFCENPVCRGMVGDLASLFGTCGSSARGQLGFLSRKARALKAGLKVCSDVEGATVNRKRERERERRESVSCSLICDRSFGSPFWTQISRWRSVNFWGAASARGRAPILVTFPTFSRIVCCACAPHSLPLSAACVRPSVRASVRVCALPQRLFDPLQSPRTAVFRSRNVPLFGTCGSSLFGTCGSSARGQLGFLRRKARALKASLKVCSDVEGATVNSVCGAWRHFSSR